MYLKIKDDEIIYLAIDEGFRFFKLEDGLMQFANNPTFTPDFFGMTSIFKCTEQSDALKLRCLIAYQLDHINYWNNGEWRYYKCTFVDSKGNAVFRQKFNQLSLNSDGFRTYFSGNQFIKFTLYDNLGYEDFDMINNGKSILSFIREFVFAIQIADTIEEFKKGLLVYDLLYRIYPKERCDFSMKMPRVKLNHKEQFFEVANNYEKLLNSIEEYKRIYSNLEKKVNPNRWED